ncbi:Ribosomal RNA small subunit methyltransferase F [Kluyvera cryocrescens]|uniref:Ribosomal RNA small subunit methyltransferase F n=1 Tax=Kluyvera cryocrescens TaxID=580 RepID=A0A485A827_KLUCR|nr:Ribosomal RNA small subunit methyltransferase F [Kluyvera cryocrescens]
MKTRESAEVASAARKVGIEWDESLALWQRDKEIWLFPTEIEPLLGKVRFLADRY